MSQTKLLYEEISNYLKNEINNGILKPGDRLPTEMELAKEFHVSRITSKRALEELRARGLIYRVRGSGSFVAERKERTAYREEEPHSIAVRKKIITLVLPFDVLRGGAMNMVAGANDVIEGKNYILSINCCNGNLEEEAALLYQLYEQGVSGIIYYPISDCRNIEIVNMFYLERFPLVCVDKYFESVPLSYVVSDNMSGAYEATKHLIELGHRRIAFLSDNEINNATSVRNRYFGYCKALKEHGIPMDLRLVKNGSFRGLDKEQGAAAVKELTGYGMTAACCINDYVADFVIQALNQNGLSVPDDVSVVGFDDTELASRIPTPLTTIRQDLVGMGRRAMEYLLNVIETGKLEREQIVLPTQLVVRQSTGVCQAKRQEA